MLGKDLEEVEDSFYSKRDTSERELQSNFKTSLVTNPVSGVQSNAGQSIISGTENGDQDKYEDGLM